MSAKALYRTGSISMMIIGLGHISFHLAMIGKNPKSAYLIQQMRDYQVKVVGVSRSMLEFHEGFSFTMGALLFFIGLQHLLLSKNLRFLFDQNKKAVLLPIVIAGVVFVFSLKYFIIIPQALSFIAFGAYVFSYWKLGRELA